MGYTDRRIEIAKAAWQAIGREGLERTSMRAIVFEKSITLSELVHKIIQPAATRVFLSLDIAR